MAEPFLGSIIIFGGNFAPTRLGDLQRADPADQPEHGALLAARHDVRRQRPDDVRAARPARPRAVGLQPGPGPLELQPRRDGRRRERHAERRGDARAHARRSRRSTSDETTNRPNNAVPARGGVYANASDGSNLAATTSAGGNQPHENRPPYLAVNYIIALRRHLPVPELMLERRPAAARRRRVPASSCSRRRGRTCRVGPARRRSSTCAAPTPGVGIALPGLEGRDRSCSTAARSAASGSRGRTTRACSST